LTGGSPEIHYFHQVDDPYSHLAVQKLDALRTAYPIPLKLHLCSQPGADYLGNSERFDGWALRDAASIAAGYDLAFPANPSAPEAAAIRALAEQLGSNAGGGGEAAVESGNTLRKQLGHYAGAMFYFEGEWYWGVDRLRLLEARLQAEGLAPANGKLLVPEPTPVDTSALDTSQVLLEYFPSLRSPYTAIGHRRVLELIERSGVPVRVRPVMPMLMRGVPAPREKQRYIISDSAREGYAHGSPLGKIVDPFGDPVRRAFALFPAALKLNKGMEFVTAYLQAAWMDGVDIATEAGLQTVAARAGLDWQALQSAREGTDWEAVLDENLNEMLGAGLWGVPSFRVSGGSGESPFSCWGQDRIWRVENEIAARAAG
jgi:2-hydroxychromene-2-carboxylate isomerase